MKTIRRTLGGRPASNFFSFQDIIMSVTGILIIIALMLALQIDQVAARSDTSLLSSDHESPSIGESGLSSLEKLLLEKKERVELMQSAARKSESAAEVDIEISRLEVQIAHISTAGRSMVSTPSDPRSLVEIRAKAAEIIRLREEIKECKEGLTEMNDSSVQVNRKMLELEQKVKDAEASVASAKLEGLKIGLVHKASDTTKEPIIIDVGANTLKIMSFDKPLNTELSSMRNFKVQLLKLRKQEQYLVLYFRPSGARWFDELRDMVREAGFEVGYDAIEENATLSLGKIES